MLKRILCLLMMTGALLGLFAQSAAVAVGPAYVATQHAASIAPMSGMDCSKMAPTQHEHTNACKGLTLACIADMGCGIPMTLEEPPAPAATLGVMPMPATWHMIPGFAGRGVSPELHPPSTLS
jgi:hypothetical protein